MLTAIDFDYFKLQMLEHREWYLRNFRVGTEARSYIFEMFEMGMLELFGDDADAMEIIEELR